MSKAKYIYDSQPSNTLLRIISGKYRGRTLKSPQSSLTHPMGARERLALFNMVYVEGLVVLDAYAGSGAIGCEALSRGAAKSDFVEDNRKIAQIIQANLASLGAQAEVFCQKVGNFASDPAHLQQYDVIFADPPYDKVSVEDLQSLAGCLKPGGTLALSSPKDMGVITIDGLRLVSQHTYARAQITIYKKS